MELIDRQLREEELLRLLDLCAKYLQLALELLLLRSCAN